MVRVGGEDFSTKKAYEARLRGLKDRPNGTVFADNDLALLIAAEARYDPHRGAHGSAVAFSVGGDFVGGWTSQKCLNVVYADGHADVMSYKNAASSLLRPRCDRAWSTRRARDEILPQVHQFRTSHPNSRCEACGAGGTEVDHREPSFARLLSDWRLLSNVAQEEWTVYHAREATLQLLCATCHAAKTRSERRQRA